MYKQPENEHTYSRETLRKELLEKSLETERKRKKAKKKSNTKKIIFVLIFFLIIAIAVLAFILIDRFKGVSESNGEVSIDESVTDEYGIIINDNTKKWRETGNKIHKDIEYSLKTTYDMSEMQDDDILVKIEVPTVDFYSSELNVSLEEAKSDKITWINYEKLTPETRVVSIDNSYFFDAFTKGARYTYLTFKADDSDKKAADWIATADQKYDQRLPQGVKNGFLSFAQTGVTALVRAMTITLNDQAGGRGSWFADNIKDFLKEKDLTHISNEASFIDGCKGSTGTMMLCSDWRSLDSITAIGTDIVELTGNHNNNYGTEANIATIKKYHELGMKTFGGGINETEASKPLQLDEKGIKITMLGYNKSSSTRGNGELADGNDPGANEYTEAKVKADIAAAKARGDFIIVDLQFSECYAYPDGYTEMPECDKPITGQQGFFRQFIDWGADIVIGTQAHHPQTYEFYKGKPIYYGLGNFFFDQTYWPGTQRGYILTHYFDVNTGKYLNTRISPTWYDKKHQVYLTNEETSENFIKRLMNSSPKGI